MGYQLPKLGNVAFPGFGALGKQQARDTTRPKKGKDQERPGISRSASTPSSPSSSLMPTVVAARPSCEGKLLEKGFLQKWRQELRPLLNSIRFVEASNRESSKDSRIGPFQISRQYHQDAWKHAPPMAWSRCRDLNHAENTIIAYWLKYCPEAVERHDFEILAKIHKGSFSSDSCQSQENPFTFAYLMSLPSYGIQGVKREEVNCYWKKISQHLKQQETAGHKKENTAWSFFSNEKNAKQDASSKLHKKATPVLSPINTNTLRSSTPPRSSCATPPKQQLPLIQTLRPKLFRRALDTEEKKAALNGPNGGARLGSAGREATAANRRLRQTSHCKSNHSLNPNSLGYAFNLSFCQLSYGERIERAAILVQARWRMRCARERFVRIRNAALLIQHRWRKHHCVLSCGQRILSREARDLDCASFPSLKTAPSCVEKQGGYVGPSGSPCELLYRADISPNQEDELLTELVSLLNLATQSPSVESCNSFRFPHSLDELTEACTPKMKPDLRNSSVELPSLSAEKRAEEPDCPSLMCVESTPLVIKQALLSPLMEKEIIAELAKLFPPCKGTSQEVVPSASLSLTISDQSFKPKDTKVDMLQEQLGKDGIIRRLTFNTAGVEGDKLNIENAAVFNVSVLERQRAQYSISSSLEITTINSKEYEEELNNINIPLLVDQSPVLTSKRRVRHQNPLNRKIERALVSSLSDWQYSVSSEEGDKDHEAFRDMPSSVNCKESSMSKEFFLSSLTKSSSIQTQPSELMEAVTDRKSCKKTLVPDYSYTDCLLETCDVKNSTIYAKAIFQCANFSLNNHEQGVLLETSHTECDAAGFRNSGGILATSSITRVVSLRRLCKLWDVHNIDLLTRSLKFKGLQAVHYQCQQGDLSLHEADGVTDIQLEINYLETLAEKVDEESKRRVSVLHQRDIIYTNIAAFCDVQERQHLYEKWEIQRVLTGRLKKIVYELLWIDPQRYQESAELVIRYL